MTRIIKLVVSFTLLAFLSSCHLFWGLNYLENSGVRGGIIVDRTGHYLEHNNADAYPFFWLGDTAWELFHRLNKEEIEKYLENRKQKGFNIIQAVILAEFNGLKKPNQYGEIPLMGLDPSSPNHEYFKLVDWTVMMAKKKNMVMGLLPTWGDKVTKLWGEGPVVFDQNNAYNYGYYLGKRYKDSRNIIWILGGDRPAVTDSGDWRPIWKAMARGIKTGSDYDAIITYHTSGGEHSTSYDLHDEDWLHINTMQSGHGSGRDVPVWEWIARDRKRTPVKPTLDLEPNYEDHPVNPWPKWDSAKGYFRDYDVRKQTYRSVFAGACGVTYGHHAVWQFWSPREEKINHADRYWTEALDRPGAFQVGYLKKLVESRSVSDRIPDQSIIKKGQGEKGEYSTAFRDLNNSYCMVYLPVGKTVTLDISFMTGKKLAVWWFNPRTGSSSGPTIIEKEGTKDFTAPTTGPQNDWVIVIDNADKKFPEPGK